MHAYWSYLTLILTLFTLICMMCCCQLQCMTVTLAHYHDHDMHEEREERFHVLQPANKSDSMCHPMTTLYVHVIPAVYDMVKIPQGIALRQKRVHGISSSRAQISILSPCVHHVVRGTWSFTCASLPVLRVEHRQKIRCVSPPKAPACMHAPGHDDRV